MPSHPVQLAPDKMTMVTLQNPPSLLVVMESPAVGMTIHAVVETTMAITPSLRAPMDLAVIGAGTMEASRIVAVTADRIATRSAQAQQLLQTPHLAALYSTE